MDPKAEEYRERAKWCDEEAKKTRDHAIKKGLEEIAQRWRDMADKIDQMPR